MNIEQAQQVYDKAQSDLEAARGALASARQAKADAVAAVATNRTPDTIAALTAASAAIEIEEDITRFREGECKRAVEALEASLTASLRHRRSALIEQMQLAPSLKQAMTHVAKIVEARSSIMEASSDLAALVTLHDHAAAELESVCAELGEAAPKVEGLTMMRVICLVAVEVFDRAKSEGTQHRNAASLVGTFEDEGALASFVSQRLDTPIPANCNPPLAWREIAELLVRGASYRDIEAAAKARREAA